MRPLTATEIVGNWATLLLPLDDDDSIDFDRLATEIDYLVSSRVDGIYSNGSACEFTSQTEAEFDRVSELLADRCEAAALPFQLGASHSSPQVSLGRVRRAARLRPSAIQVILPDWFPPTDAEAIAALDRYAQAAGDVPLVLYNPPHSKRVLAPRDFATLKNALPSLVGVKVADGDEAWYAAMREHTAGLSVFVPGHNLATGVKRGLASGAYSNVACLSPRGAQAWWITIRADLERALEIESRIQAFQREHILPFRTLGGYQNVALDKLLAAIGDWCDLGARVRWPYRWIDPREAARLRPIAHRAIPELFAEEPLVNH